MKLKQIILVVAFLLPFQTLLSQSKGDAQKTFSKLQWTDANAFSDAGYEKFGYEAGFELKKQKIKPNDKYAGIIRNEDITFIGTFKSMKFFFSPGPSIDPTFYVLNSNNKIVLEFMGEEMCVKSSGIIYASGNINHMFMVHEKYKIEGEKIVKVEQPFMYVGIKNKLKKNIKLYSKPNKGGTVIATLPKGYEVEVLLSSDDNNYLVKTTFGLVGWMTIEDDEIYIFGMVIKGLGYMGD